jgi:uncharacterized protein (DUF362 family)
VQREQPNPKTEITMDRRTFIEQVAAWSAGACLTTPLFDVRSILAAESGPRGKAMLAVAKGKEYEALVGQVLQPLGGIIAFVRPGDRVVVKPNIGWDRTPEQGNNTHPDVVRGVVKLCLEAGAKQVVVLDHSVGEPRRCYARSGIQGAVESVGDSRARCIFPDKRRLVPVDIADGKSLKQVDFYQDVLATDCDCYINVPVAKHHEHSKLTLGLKNTMGVIDKRGEIHKDLHQRIADLNLVVRSKLTVIDATRILLRNGPAGGKPEDVKVLDTVIASADVVAVDAYATTLFGMKPEEVGATVAAAKHGLGEIDLSKVSIVEV